MRTVNEVSMKRESVAQSSSGGLVISQSRDLAYVTLRLWASSPSYGK